MTSAHRAGLAGAFGSCLLLVVCPAALGATATFDFENLPSASYGTADANCVNNPTPPLFNRPEYGTQTASFIVDPAGCGEGTIGGSGGSDSLLTAFFRASAPNSNEVRFSWVDPTLDTSWLRLITFAAQSVSPH